MLMRHIKGANRYEGTPSTATGIIRCETDRHPTHRQCAEMKRKDDETSREWDSMTDAEKRVVYESMDKRADFYGDY